MQEEAAPVAKPKEVGAFFFGGRWPCEVPVKQNTLKSFRVFGFPSLGAEGNQTGDRNPPVGAGCCVNPPWDRSCLYPLVHNHCRNLGAKGFGAFGTDNCVK